MKLKVPSYLIAALLGLALAFSTGEALAKRPLVNTVKKGVDAIEGIAKGAAKGTRGAFDDIGQGVARGADDLGEGAAKGVDDILEGAAEGADDAAGAGRAMPPAADDALAAPHYADAPPLDDAGQVLKYDVVPDEAADDIGNAADLPDVPQNVPGYIAPDAPGFADDLAAAGDSLDAAPGNYLAPDSPLGIDPNDVAPLKPDKIGKKALPKLDKTKVAKVTPLNQADDVAADGFQGLQVAAVKVLGKLDPDVGAAAARKAAKAKAKKIRNIKAGVATAVVAAAVGTTLILYFTVEPVKNDLDVAKAAVDGGFKTFGEVLSGGAKKLTVNNVANGPVEIFKLDTDANLVTIGAINETPGSTRIDVKKGDIIVIHLAGEEYGERFVIEDWTDILVQ